MSGRLEMKGLSELRAVLRQLPEETAQEANVIAFAHAQLAKQQIQAAYPQGKTGNLRHGVTVTRADQRFSARAIVRSRAKHAHLFEYGTKTRKTKAGWNRGRMPEAPPTQAMIPIVIRQRRAMVRALIDLVRRSGLFRVKDAAA